MTSSVYRLAFFFGVCVGEAFGGAVLPTAGHTPSPAPWRKWHDLTAAEPTPPNARTLVANGGRRSHIFLDTLTSTDPWHMEFELEGGANGNAAGNLRVRAPGSCWTFAFGPLVVGQKFDVSAVVGGRLELLYPETPELGRWRITYINNTGAPIGVDGGIVENESPSAHSGEPTNCIMPNISSGGDEDVEIIIEPVGACQLAGSEQNCLCDVSADECAAAGGTFLGVDTDCVGVCIPTVSTWGLVALTLLTLCAATVVLIRHKGVRGGAL